MTTNYYYSVIIRCFCLRLFVVGVVARSIHTLEKQNSTRTNLRLINDKRARRMFLFIYASESLSCEATNEHIASFRYF